MVGVTTTDGGVIIGDGTTAGDTTPTGGGITGGATIAPTGDGITGDTTDRDASYQNGTCVAELSGLGRRSSPRLR